MAVAMVVVVVATAVAGGFLLNPPPQMQEIIDGAGQHQGAGRVVAVDLTSFV